MTDENNSPRGAALQELEDALQRHRRQDAVNAGTGSEPGSERREFGLRPAGWRLPFNPWFMFDRRHPVIRRITLIVTAVVAVGVVVTGALWWRLASGPIAFDVATPWLTAAIEQNFGPRYRVQVGGTQLERDDNGRTALRLRDIAVRDVDGVLVATAPKAEVG